MPVSARPGDASAVKMAYAAWTKGTAALLLAARAVARAEGVEEALVREWALSLPELEGECARAGRSAAAKGWRWVGEMEEIAATFAAAGQPDGFRLAAAEVSPLLRGCGGEWVTANRVVRAELERRRGAQSPMISANAGSPRIASSSGSFAAIMRIRREPAAARRASSAASVRPALLSQTASM